MGSLDEVKHLHSDGQEEDSNGIQVQELDALVVGAGFGGVYQLRTIRDAGYKVKLVEQGADYGGVWFWNRYPGARVDVEIPHYEFSDPELWKDWTWKQRFPGSGELRAYFAHVDEKWGLREDTQFNTFVSSAIWYGSEARWKVKTQACEVYSVKYLLLNTGFAAKRYIPDWKGIDSFKGNLLQPSYWPHEEPELAGKRIAIIGTGASGVQIAQELRKVASQLTVFQRTPNMCLPMGQVIFDLPKQKIPKLKYPDLYAGRTDSFTGLGFNFLPRSTFDDSPEKRLETYEELWSQGDFHFWLATYNDMLFNKEANAEAYKFWRNKTRAKINDSEVADILAPMEQPHAFGCKRISLENDYFQIYNEPNVALVDISDKGTPILNITEKGIKTTDKEHEFDVIILATGYDALTGGLTQIDIRGASGESLKDYWKDGVKTYLGLAVSSFPNMFFTYGPHGPTALCNGPTCAELQGNWILQAMNYMNEKGLKNIDVEKESEDEYKNLIWNFANASLLPGVDSWYMGANIPNKPREPLVWLGGVPEYYKTINKSAAEGYSGFNLS